MGTFVFGDGKDINRDIDVFGESNDTKDSNDKGSIDFGTALMNEIFNSDDAIDLNKIPETDMIADGVNTNTSSDNQPKFINKPMPNPEYFKMGEAYHIHRKPSIPKPLVFGNYSDIPGGNWVGILTDISTNGFTFICYPIHPGDLCTIHVSFDEFGEGPGETDITRLSNVLSNNVTCIPNTPVRTAVINDPRVRILDKSVIYRSLHTIGFTDNLVLTLVRILNHYGLPNTLEGLITYMLRTDGRDSFIEFSYGIGEKRMDEIISILKHLGIQIDGYSID